MTDTNSTAPARGERYQARRALGLRPASMEFPEPLYQALKRQGEFEERSMAFIIRAALREYFERHAPPPRWKPPVKG